MNDLVPRELSPTSLDLILARCYGEVGQVDLDAMEADWRQETLENLAALGYFPSGPEPEAVAEGLNAFMTEAGLDTGTPLPDAAALLGALLVFEGDNQDAMAHRAVEVGSAALCVRLAKYRLAKLGFYQGPVDPFSSDALARAVALFRLAFGFSAIEEPLDELRALLPLLSDPYGLNRRLIAALGWQPVIGRLVDHFPDLRNATRAKTHMTRCNWDDTNIRFTEQITTKSMPIQDLEELANRPVNRAGVALLQFWLWMLSLRTEPVTGMFDLSTAQGIRVFLEERNQAGDKEGRYFVRISSGIVAMAPALFGELGVECPSREKTEEYEHQVCEKVCIELKEMDDARTKDSNAPVREGFFARIWKKLKLSVSKLYQGVRLIAHIAGQALSSMAQRFWSSAEGGLFGNHGGHIVSMVGHWVKQMVQRTWYSMKLLAHFAVTGTVETASETGACVTYFEPDFDCVTVYAGLALSAIPAEAHIKRVRDLGESIKAACRILMIVFTTVRDLLSGVVGWLRLGLRISRAIWERLGTKGALRPLAFADLAAG